MYHHSWRDETGSVRTTTPSPSASPTLVGDHDYDDDNDKDKASTVSTHLGPGSGSPDEWPHDDQDDDSNCADSDDGVVHYDNVTWDHTDLSAWDYKINRYDTIDERPYDDFGSDHDEHDHHGESKDPMVLTIEDSDAEDAADAYERGYNLGFELGTNYGRYQLGVDKPKVKDAPNVPVTPPMKHGTVSPSVPMSPLAMAAMAQPMHSNGSNDDSSRHSHNRAPSRSRSPTPYEDPYYYRPCRRWSTFFERYTDLPESRMTLRAKTLKRLRRRFEFAYIPDDDTQ